MKKLFTFLAICCIISTLYSQSQFQSIIVNKPLKEFPDVYDLSTPLNAGVTTSYFLVNGTESLWRDASTYTNSLRHEKGTIPNVIVEKEIKELLLNDTIKEVLVYKDSIACMITQKIRGNSKRHSIRVLFFEDDKWLNLCEDGRSTLEEVQIYWDTYAPEYLNELRRSNEIKTVSTDTLSFVNYVKQYGTEPKEFLLETLSKYPLVIYGEIHRRKVSWDLLSSLLTDLRFPEIVGTVFVELPAYQQDEFDRFFASEKLDTEIVLDIMCSFQVYGWWDRGEYDFFVNLWRLNQTLPIEKRIRVVPTDEQAPWKLLHSKEDFDKWEENFMDRNTKMANVVENTLKTKTDKRNCLFVVGYNHAYKSHVPGGYSYKEEAEPLLSAGAQLVQRLSNNNAFTILQHGPWLTNTRGAIGLVRQGLFDYVFETNGNKPVAFPLVDSPFGAEPYDADFDNCFDYRAGNFEDNFDGYIFLQPLKDEDEQYVLYDIWSDQFVNEFKRRASFLGWDANKWLGNEGDLTKEKIIKVFKEDEGKKRWGYLFE